MDKTRKTGKVYDELFGDHHTDMVVSDLTGQILEDRFPIWFKDLSWFENKSALDVGCGSGKYTLALEKICKEVTGVDLHPQAKKRVKSFVQASGLDLPFRDESFDFVFSSGVAHHTENPRKFFEECVRVLRKNGRMYFAVYRKCNYFRMNSLLRPLRYVVPYKFAKKFFGFDLDNIYTPIVKTYSKRQLEHWFSVYGLRVIMYQKGKTMHRYYLEKIF